MRKSILLIISCLIFLLNCYRIRTDTLYTKYLPLAVGNEWVYNWLYTGPPPTGGICKCRVIKDTLINSKKYYLCNLPGLALYPQLIRMDSVTGNILGYSSTGGCTYQPSEILIDSLKSKKLDVTNFCNYVRRKCIDTGFVNLFGSQFTKKDFDPIQALTASTRKYAKNLGIYFLNEGDPYVTIYGLKGCVINGVVYGDTSMPVGIVLISNAVPDRFHLFQNCPNPFNPSTKIKFDVLLDSRLRGNDNVNLKIYDVLGREIAVLVNEPLSPGTYEVEWDGTNYPSGVYFYKLITVNFSEIKKLILIK